MEKIYVVTHRLVDEDSWDIDRCDYFDQEEYITYWSNEDKAREEIESIKEKMKDPIYKSYSFEIILEEIILDEQVADLLYSVWFEAERSK